MYFKSHWSNENDMDWLILILYKMWQTVAEIEETIAKIFVHFYEYSFVYHFSQVLPSMCRW